MKLQVMGESGRYMNLKIFKATIYMYNLSQDNLSFQNICEDIFLPRAQNFYRGLLVNPPEQIALELKQLLEDCAYPNHNKGEIVRTPTPKEVFWKLHDLLKRSRKMR